MSRFKNLLNQFFSKSKSAKIVKKEEKILANYKKKPRLAEDFDYIGPADKISNLRPLRIHVPKNESKVEYEYRILREKIFDFNNQYWTQQNLKFIESKRKFIENYKFEQKYLRGHSEKEIEEPDAVKMNEFYKNFLNENYESHYDYNRQWFKYNIKLLWPATKVFFYRVNKKLTAN